MTTLLHFHTVVPSLSLVFLSFFSFIFSSTFQVIRTLILFSCIPHPLPGDRFFSPFLTPIRLANLVENERVVSSSQIVRLLVRCVSLALCLIYDIAWKTLRCLPASAPTTP